MQLCSGVGCGCVRFDLVKVEVARSAGKSLTTLLLALLLTRVELQDFHRVLYLRKWSILNHFAFQLDSCQPRRVKLSLGSEVEAAPALGLRARTLDLNDSCSCTFQPSRSICCSFFPPPFFSLKRPFFSTPPSSVALFTALHIRRKGVVFSAARSRYRPGPSPTKRNAFFFLPQH